MYSLRICIALFAVSAQAFVPSPRAAFLSSTSRYGNMEQIEFKIYPDGRIEETVRGIKGGDCHKVTEEINNSLGKVVHTKPTEELYEQEITIDQTVKVNNGVDGGGWEGSSSW